MYYGLISSMKKAVESPYPASLKLFIDAGNPASYSGTGTTVTDLIGTQNGTLTNGVGYSSSNGGYFTFDGVNDYIDFGINNAIRPISAGTISTWVYVDSTEVEGAFYSFSNVTGYTGVDIWLDNSGYRSAVNGIATYQIVTNKSANTKGVWYYLTLSWNGTTLKAYLNGVLNTSVAQTVTIVNNITNSSKMGVYGSGTAGFLKGNISQLKIYNTQLSDTDVLTDFNEFKARYGY